MWSWRCLPSMGFPQPNLRHPFALAHGSRVDSRWGRSGKAPHRRNPGRAYSYCNPIAQTLCPSVRCLQSQSCHFSLLQLSITKVGRLGVQTGQGVIYSIT